MKEAQKNLTKEQLASWLDMEEDEFYINEFRKRHEISPESTTLYMSFNRFCEEKVLKRIGRGWYRKLKKIKPVKWWEADEDVYYDFRFPRGHGDDTSFGFEDLIALSPGDLVVISGVSNTGKSALVLNILGENIANQKCVLMGNEYTSLDGVPSPKFKRRMNRMDWVEWMNGDGTPKFDLLPIRENFEDYVERGKLNIIDWINLTDQFYKIGKIFEDIKVAAGDGVAVAVLQKEEQQTLGRGKGFTRDLSDLYLTIDPLGEYQSRLTVGKVKDAKGWVTNRSWGFKIIDGGANLGGIREIKKCRNCWGKGYTNRGSCEDCLGTGWIDK